MKSYLGILLILAWGLAHSTHFAAAPAAENEGRSGKGVDWAGYQGPRGNSTTPETNWRKDWPADGPPVLWRAQAGMGLTSFAVVGNQAYTAGNNGEDQDSIFCFDLTTGNTLWKHDLSTPTKCHAMPIVPYGPAATTTVAEGRLYFISREGALLCLNSEDGSLLWKKDLVTDLGGKRPVYGYSGSPAVHAGRLYLDVGGTGKSTACLDAKTGDVVWQTGDGEAGYSTPALVRDGEVLMLFKGEALELRRAKDGRLLASHATTTRDFCNCATPLLIEDTLFISHTGNMGARALSWKGDTLTELWSDRDVGLLFHSGLPWKKHVMVFNDQVRGSNDMRLIDVTTGKALWQNKEVPKGTGLLCDDGHAILLTSMGELVLAQVKEDALDIISRVQALPAKCWCQPVLSHGRLLCKNNAGEVVCYDLR